MRIEEKLISLASPRARSGQHGVKTNHVLGKLAPGLTLAYPVWEP